MRDLSKIPLDDEKTWSLICAGDTVGCFQIESRLGRQYCKKAQPRTIEDLAAVVTIIRPSCLEAKLEDGINIAEHYVKRKMGQEPATAEHKCLEPILKDTQNLLLYQEQTIKIGQDIAGMSLAESDRLLRKGIGKKISHLIAEAKQIFISNSVKMGNLTQQEAEEVFGWIEKGQRYGFNKSHAVSYALLAYYTAYDKANNGLKAYAAYLNHAYDKPKPLEEIDRLVVDAKLHGINILVPDIRHKNINFKPVNNEIVFGLTSIKGLGEAVCQQLVDSMPDNIDKMSWCEALFKYCIPNRASAIKTLIACGAFDFLRMPRLKMIYEHDQLVSLKEHEIDYIVNNVDLSKASVSECLRFLTQSEVGRGKAITNSRRYNTLVNIVMLLENPPYSLKDTAKNLINWETSFLGSSITTSEFDLIEKTGYETVCKNFEESHKSQHLVIGKIRRVNVVIDKNDKEMAFLSIADDTGEIDSVVVFAKEWEEYNLILNNAEIVKLKGYKQSEKNSLIFLSCEEIK
jgi:DNA polymerase III alpha subunit